MALSTTFSHFLNTCRVGDFTTTLGSPFQYLTTLSIKKFFLMSNMKPSWWSLRPCALVLSLIFWEKKPTPHGRNLLSGGCREWQGLPWVSFTPGYRMCFQRSAWLPLMDKNTILQKILTKHCNREVSCFCDCDNILSIQKPFWLNIVCRDTRGGQSFELWDVHVSNGLMMKTAAVMLCEPGK